MPIANQLDLQGLTVANATYIKPVFVTASGMTLTVNVQVGRHRTGSPANNNDVGMVSFDDTMFNVDEFGFVTLIGGSDAIDSIAVDTYTDPGTNPVMPTVLGLITITGNQVAAGVIGSRVIRTNSLAANTFTIEIQRSDAVGSEDSTKNGVSHFDSGYFTITAGGFVSLSGTAVGSTITGNTGGPLSPTAGNWNIITDNSTVVFAGAGSTLTQDFGLSNLALGSEMTNVTSGTNNAGFGNNALDAITTGSSNCVFGENAADALQSGSNNCAFGVASLGAATTSSNNTLFGHNTGNLISTGTGGNVAVGYQALNKVTTGQYNTCVGYQAGFNYTSTEANNIIIGANVTGTLGESNVTRIGGSQNTCYVDGVYHVDNSVAEVVTVTSGDKFGSSLLTAGTGITINVGAGTITINAEDSGFVWQDASGAISAAKNNGYFITGTATGTLPGSPSIGDTIKFFVDHASQVLTLQANTGQIIRMGTLVSSTAGTAVSTQQGDSVDLVYRATNSSWEAINFIGTWIMS